MSLANNNNHKIYIYIYISAVRFVSTALAAQFLLPSALFYNILLIRGELFQVDETGHYRFIRYLFQPFIPSRKFNALSDSLILFRSNRKGTLKELNRTIVDIVVYFFRSLVEFSRR